VRLRHQALTILLAAACLGGSGCARLIGHFLAPQEAALSAAQSVADTAVAPVRGDIASVTSEVDRLLLGKGVDVPELQRIKAELARRAADPTLGPAAQDEAERLRPWHPRVADAPAQLGRAPKSDDLHLGWPAIERGIAKPGPLPDGIPASELPVPLDLSRVRLGAPRRR
jgi:hypothetical protein